MITLLIVEDHLSMREAIALAFKTNGNFKVIGELSKAQFAPIFARKYKPDLIFMNRQFR